MRIFLSFIIMLAAVLLVLSLLGWFWFSLKYRYTGHFRGISIGLVSIDLNYLVHYYVIMKVNPDGFYLKLPLILRLFHPPLFIPWNDVRNVRDEKFTFVKYKRLFIGNPGVGNIRISYSTALLSLQLRRYNFIFIKRIMSKGGYKIFDQGGLYYVSFAVVAWVDVFTRREYRDIVIESLQHCQKEKGLVVYAWCIMSNLIISAKENNVSSVLGDFKKYTSKQIIKAIKENPGESRREWMLKIFKEAGEQSSRNDSYQFWIQDNQPKVIYTEAFAAQKLGYIHDNPVDAGIVEKAEEYIYSSARNYYFGKQCGLIEIEFLL